MRFSHFGIWFLSFWVAVFSAEAGNVAISTIFPGDNVPDSWLVTDRNGVVLPAGSGYVAVGTFIGTDADVRDIGIRENWAELLDRFLLFGRTGTVSSFGGIIAHDAAAPLAEGDVFVGKPIYGLIGNGGDASSSTDWLVYKSDEVFDVDAPLFAASVDLFNPTEENLLIGSFGKPVFQPDLGVELRALSLGPPVPEPTALSLMLVACCTLLGRRCR